MHHKKKTLQILACLQGRDDWKFLHKTCALVCTLPQWSRFSSGDGNFPSTEKRIYIQSTNPPLRVFVQQTKIHTKAQNPPFYIHVGISENK